MKIAPFLAAPLLAAPLLAALFLAALAAPALAQEAGPAAFQATTLSLSAYGEVRGAPDIATLTLGVQTSGATAAAALSENRDRMSATIGAIKAAGIEAKDIQTSGLNLEAQYVYKDGEPRRLTGYQATNKVTVTVRAIPRLGGVVDAVVAAGANQVNGISFGLSDPTAMENEARQAAVKALQAKADLYAAATGHRILRLVNLSEGGGEVSAPRPFAVQELAVTGSRRKASPVEAGELKLRVDISGLYELAR